MKETERKDVSKAVTTQDVARTGVTETPRVVPENVLGDGIAGEHEVVTGQVDNKPGAGKQYVVSTSVTGEEFYRGNDLEAGKKALKQAREKLQSTPGRSKQSVSLWTDSKDGREVIDSTEITA